MAKIIRRDNKFVAVSHSFNTAGNRIKKGQKAFVLGTDKQRKDLILKMRRKGFLVK